MDYKNIQSLLDKYWEGETTLQEEESLKQYFNNGNVASEFQQFQPLFQYFKEEQDVMISDDFEQRLLEQLQNQPEAKVRQLNWRRMLSAVAAVGIVLLGAFFIYQNINKENAQPYADRPNVIVFHDDIEDQQEAYEATKLALQLLSGKMRKGSKKADQGFAKIKEAKKRTFK